MNLTKTLTEILSEELVKEKLSDLILAATIYGEAGGEGEQGMKAVANVIKNRADSKGISPKDVVLKPKQFSMWNNKQDKKSQINYIKNINSQALKNPNVKSVWDKAKSLVSTHINSKGDDVTKGAEYYHTISIKPYWTKNLEYTTTIGKHKFYKPLIKSS